MIDITDTDYKDVKDLLKEAYTLKARLTVRNCQYDIAVEGLKAIVDSNDPIGIAEKTLNAIGDCIP